MTELNFQICTEEYCKKHYIKYRELVKLNNKVQAFITLNSTEKGYEYAFGKPSQKSYISFSGKNEPLTLEQARERIKEQIENRIQVFSKSGIHIV